MQSLAGQLRAFRLGEATQACLDTILSLLLDAEGNQVRFVQLQGIEKVRLRAASALPTLAASSNQAQGS